MQTIFEVVKIVLKKRGFDLYPDSLWHYEQQLPCILVRELCKLRISFGRFILGPSGNNQETQRNRYNTLFNISDKLRYVSNFFSDFEIFAFSAKICGKRLSLQLYM
jgi:hypothetical protein